MNCTQVLLKFLEYYVPVLELSLNRCTETQLIMKILVLTSITYLSSHCTEGMFRGNGPGECVCVMDFIMTRCGT